MSDRSQPSASSPARAIARCASRDAAAPALQSPTNTAATPFWRKLRRSWTLSSTRIPLQRLSTLSRDARVAAASADRSDARKTRKPRPLQPPYRGSRHQAPIAPEADTGDLDPVELHSQRQ